MKRMVLALLGVGALACRPLEATLVIRGAAVFDGEAARGRVDVAVDGDRIVAIGAALAVVPTAQVVDGASPCRRTGAVVQPDRVPPATRLFHRRGYRDSEHRARRRRCRNGGITPTRC